MAPTYHYGTSLITGERIAIVFPSGVLLPSEREATMPDVIVDVRAPAPAPTEDALPTEWWQWVFYYLGLWG